MDKSNSDKLRIFHIRENIDLIFSGTDNISFEEFDEDWIKRNAIIRCFEIIGEATNHISEDLKEKYPDVDWLPSKRMRNFLIHEYFMVDNILVWGTVKNNLPKLKLDIQKIIKELE
jgi:uncharacterized protein with HEPN domain